MNNNKFERLKKIYHSQALPEETVEQLWQNLSSRLPKRQYHPYYYTIRYAFLTLCITFLALGGVVGLAQAAKPNTPLYPVKVLSDRIVAKATNTYHVSIQKRATEVIDAARNKSLKDLQQSTKAYSESLEDVKTEEKTSETSKMELKETLEQTKEKLEHITPADTASQNLIHQSIKETEETKEEVKGAHTENRPDNLPDNNRGVKKEHQDSKESYSDNSQKEEEHGNSGKH